MYKSIKVITLSIVIFCIQISFANAKNIVINYDSTSFQQLTEASSKRFLELQAYNNLTSVQISKSYNYVMEYDIEFGHSASADSALFIRRVSSNTDFISASKHSELNTFLKTFNQQQSIAAYVVIINVLNYKLKIEIDTDTSGKFVIASILSYQSKIGLLKNPSSANQKQIDEIEALKELHAAISEAVQKGIPNTTPYVLQDFGVYKSVGGPKKELRTFLGMYHFNQVPEDKQKHLADLLKQKFNGSLPSSSSNNDIAGIIVNGTAAAVSQTEIKRKILSTYSRDSMCSLLNPTIFTFDYNTYESNAYKALTLKERIHCISVLLDGYVNGNWFDLTCNSERKLLTLLKSTPTDQISDLLEALKKKTPLKGTPGYTYAAGEVEYALVYRLIEGIDGDNYDDLMMVFTDLCKRRPTGWSEEAALVFNKHEYERRLMNWKPDASKDNIGVIRVDNIDFGTNGKIKVSRSILSKVYFLTRYCAYGAAGSGGATPCGQDLYAEWQNYGTETEYDPFDLVVFTNFSDVSIINSTSQVANGEIKLVPAIFLKYADQKTFNQTVYNNTVNTVVFVLDVATIATGVGAFYTAATWSKRAWAAFEIINAGINIAVNASEISNIPEYQEALKWYNLITGGIGAAAVLRSASKSMPAVLDALNQNYSSLVNSLNVEHVLNFFKAVKNFGQKISTYPTNLHASLTQQYNAMVEVCKTISVKIKRLYKYDLPEDLVILKGPGSLADNLTGALKSIYDDIIRVGGSEVEHNGVLKLFSKNGDEVAQISNGKILPTKYFDEVAHNGATLIGQPANGYQVLKKGDDLVVKRMPDKSAYSANELTDLTQHPNAHVLERHGHDVTDEALVKRANTGIAPDGSRTASGNPPPYSSKFESSQKLIEALNNTKPGTIAFTNGIQQGNRKIVSYTSNSGFFGKGVPSNGNTFQSTNKVLAIYQDIGGGNYQLLTMYPDF